MENLWLKVSPQEAPLTEAALTYEPTPIVGAEVFSPEQSANRLTAFFPDRWARLRERRPAVSASSPQAQGKSRLPFTLSATETLSAGVYEVATLAPFRIIGMEAVRSVLRTALEVPGAGDQFPKVGGFHDKWDFRRPGMADGKLHRLYEKADNHIRRFDAGVESPVMQRKLRQYKDHYKVAPILAKTPLRRP